LNYHLFRKNIYKYSMPMVSASKMSLFNWIEEEMNVIYTIQTIHVAQGYTLSIYIAGQ